MHRWRNAKHRSPGTAGTLASLRGATRSIFRGTFPGSGDTIIRCTWTGSVEGIRDVAVPQNQTFLPQSALTGSGTSYTGPNSVTAYHTSTASTQSAAAKFAFSDVYPTTSPYDVSRGGFSTKDFSR